MCPVISPRRRLSVATSFDYGVPIEEQVPLIAAAGFTHLSLGPTKRPNAHAVPEPDPGSMPPSTVWVRA
jgi:hypothetical protein